MSNNGAQQSTYIFLLKNVGNTDTLMIASRGFVTYRNLIKNVNLRLKIPRKKVNTDYSDGVKKKDRSTAIVE